MKEKKQQKSKSPEKKQKEEYLTERELREMMGEFMPTYTRKNGAITNKRNG